MTSALPPLVQAISGAIGSAGANIASYPLDLVCTRVQLADNAQKQSLYSVLYHTVKTQSISSLYEGVETDTAATLISNFLYFYAYSYFRSLINKRKFVASRAPHVVTVLEEIGAGFLAGVASRAVSTPLGLVTVRLQEERQNTDASVGRTESIKRIIKSIYSEHGLKGFWRGFQTTAMLCLNPSFTFFFFQVYRRLLLRGRHQINPSPREAFIGAAISNVLAVSLLYPLILAKTRLQSAKSKTSGNSKNMIDIWKDAYARSGYRGLYQGLEAQLMKGFINQGLTMMTKQRIEQLIISFYLNQTRKADYRSPFVLFARNLSNPDEYIVPVLASITVRIKALSDSDKWL